MLGSLGKAATMVGTLFIVSTPIGNLEDITYRAIRTLKEVSTIAAEDTRRTKKLCTHYGIGTALTSYHDFNKEEKTPVFLERLKEGEHFALVSDAGTPLISDPGFYLVRHAIAAKIPIVPIPGPSAVLAALVASGFPPDAFTFDGFVPRKSGARLRLFERIEKEGRTAILFETPHRLRSTLVALQETVGNRKLIIARELTKLHEEILRGTAEEILESGLPNRIQGEVTIVVEGIPGKKRRPTGNHADA